MISFSQFHTCKYVILKKFHWLFTRNKTTFYKFSFINRWENSDKLNLKNIFFINLLMETEETFEK